MQYWIQPDTDTSSINSLQREIGQIAGIQINYANSPEGFMFYINEMQKNNWDWNIKSSDNKYFVSIFLQHQDFYQHDGNQTKVYYNTKEDVSIDKIVNEGNQDKTPNIKIDLKKVEKIKETEDSTSIIKNLN